MTVTYDKNSTRSAFHRILNFNLYAILKALTYIARATLRVTIFCIRYYRLVTKMH